MDDDCNSGGGGFSSVGGGFSSGGGGFSSGGGGFSSGGGGFSSGGGDFSSGGGDCGIGGSFSSGGGTDFGGEISSGGGFSSGGGINGGGGFSQRNSKPNFGGSYSNTYGAPPSYSEGVQYSTQSVGYAGSPSGGHVFTPHHGGMYTANLGQPLHGGVVTAKVKVTYVGGPSTTVYQRGIGYNRNTCGCAKSVLIIIVVSCVAFVILAIIIPLAIVSANISNMN